MKACTGQEKKQEDSNSAFSSYLPPALGPRTLIELPFGRTAM